MNQAGPEWKTLAAAGVFLIVTSGIAAFDQKKLDSVEARVEIARAESDARERMLVRLESVLDPLRKAADPRWVDSAATAAGLSPRTMVYADTWSLEVEGSPGELARLVGPTLRSARFVEGAEAGELKAALIFEPGWLASPEYGAGAVETWLTERESRSAPGFGPR